MDDLDKLNDQTEYLQRANLYKSRRSEADADAIGECLFCGESVEEGRRWCNAQCRNDWEIEVDGKEYKLIKGKL